ncbi:MAG: DUF3352 domain-containing protein [Gaiellaceae bacterium]
MRARFVLAAAAGVVAVLAAGCGGGSGTATPGATGAAASVAPASSVAFIALDTDLASSQWQTVNALLAKLPGASTLLTQLRQRLEQKSSLSWANDVQPAVGSELDVAVLPAAANGKPEAVALVQPTDPAKFDALLAALGSGATRPVTAQVGGWTVIASTQAALDAVTSATSHLDGSSLYQAASAKLASDVLVTAYANGAEARRLVGALGGTPPSAPQLDWAAGDVVASSGGLRVDGFVSSASGTPTRPYDAALLQKIPSGQLLVADFQASRDATASTATPASPLLGALGKVADTLGGESALYVSPAALIPAVTLVTQSSDSQQTLDAIQGALKTAGSKAGGGIGSILGALTLSHATVGSDLVVSTSQQQVAAFERSGRKLNDDAAFQAARAASGMPAKTSGFVYVNLKDALPAVQGLASLAGGSLQLPSGLDLSALRSLTAYGSGSSGGVSSFTVFLSEQS